VRRLGDILEELLSRFIGGVQIGQVELMEDGFLASLLLEFVYGDLGLGLRTSGKVDLGILQKELFASFPADAYVSAGDNKDLFGEVGDVVYRPFRCGRVYQSEDFEECVVEGHGGLVEGEKGGDGVTGV
jgi:hypothetical protein